jgi:hypothetical protein
LLLALASQAIADELDPIKPAPLTKDVTVVELDAAFEQMCVGGGGRFLIFSMPSIRQVAIFDTNAAKVVKSIPTSGNNVRIADGANSLILAFGDQQVISRWSLKTFERELAITMDFATGVASMAMGSASTGPLLIAKQGESTYGAVDKGLVFLDIDTLKPIPMAFPNVSIVTSQWSERTLITASAAGQLFVLSQSETVVLRYRGPSLGVTGGLRDPQSRLTGGLAFVGAKGRYIYSPLGIFSSDLSPVYQPMPRQTGVVRIPAIQGNYYLTVSWPVDGNIPPPPPIQLSLAGSPEQIVSIPGIDPFEDSDRPFLPSHMPSLARNLLLIPAAKLLVQVPMTRDKLVLRRFDIDEALDESGIDFLFVNSLASPETRPGASYEYAVDVKSKAGVTRFSLLSAPKGMTVSQTGIVSWKVPNVFDYSDVHVVLKVEDELEQQVLHSFRIATGGVQGTAPSEPAAPAELSSTVASEDRNPFKTVGDTQDFAQLPEITPVQLTGKNVKRIDFPATAEDIKLGGGGRYVILHFKSLRKLGVLDVSVGKIVGYIPVSGAQVGYAAGANRLIVVSSDLGIISRWNLVTQKRELTRPIAARGPLAHVLMGHALATHWPAPCSSPSPSAVITSAKLSVSIRNPCAPNRFSSRHPADSETEHGLRSQPRARRYASGSRRYRPVVCKRTSDKVTPIGDSINMNRSAASFRPPTATTSLRMRESSRASSCKSQRSVSFSTARQYMAAYTSALPPSEDRD